MPFLYSKASLATITMACLFASAAPAQEAYLCIPTAAGGVRFDEPTKRWLGAAFNTEDKYIVRSPKPEEKKYSPEAKWSVFSYRASGEQYIYGHCDGDFYPNGFLKCGGFFEMNKVNLRFLFIDTGVAIAWGKEGGTPHIKIGMCSPI